MLLAQKRDSQHSTVFFAIESQRKAVDSLFVTLYPWYISPPPERRPARQPPSAAPGGGSATPKEKEGAREHRGKGIQEATCTPRNEECPLHSPKNSSKAVSATHGSGLGAAGQLTEEYQTVYNAASCTQGWQYLYHTTVHVELLEDVQDEVEEQKFAFIRRSFG